VSGALTKLKRWNKEGTVLQTFYGNMRYTVRVIELKTDVILSVALENMKIWKVSTGECLRTLDEGEGAKFVSKVLKLSRNKFVTWGHDCTMRVWNDDGDCIETIPTEDNIMAMSRFGDQIITTFEPMSSSSGISVRRIR